MAESSDKKAVTLKEVFAKIDADGSGHLDTHELRQALIESNISDDVVDQILAEADTDDDGKITEKEFLHAMREANKKNGKVGELSTLVKAQAQLLQVHSESGGVHAYSTEEVNAFSEHINAVLEGDKQLAHVLPIALDGADLFSKVFDGLLLGKFVNKIKEDALDTRALNYAKKGKSLSLFKINENLNLVINSTRSLGVHVHNVGCGDINDVRNPSLVLGLLWQMVKMHLLSDINLKAHPELIRLLREGESMEDFLKLSAEEILKRWMNFHLAESGSSKRIDNFSGHVKDSEAYAIVMEQVAPPNLKNQVPKGKVLDLKGNSNRAATAIEHAQTLGCRPFVKPKDIASGNPKLNLAFVADLFNHCPGLEELNEEEAKDLFGLDDDATGEREELAFRCWANNLGIEDFFIKNLFDACADGLSLLKIIDAIEPGLVNWKKVQKKPKMVFHKNNNHDYALSLLRSIGKNKETDIGIKFVLVGIGGKNITDGSKMYILSAIWQLYRYHSVKFLANLRANADVKITDDLILEWANEMVTSVGGDPLRSFSDSAGGDGVWACNLVKAIDAEVFDDEFVSTENTSESNRLNARYAISVARRHGCLVFLLPDDILECNKKLVLTFAAAVIKKSKNL